MKKTTFTSCCLALATGLFVLMSSCSNDESIPIDESLTTKAAGPSVNGQGTLSFDGIPIEGEGFRHFTFHARVLKDGSVQGNGVLTYIGGVRNISFDINCLNVDGNHAIMSGVTTRDNQFPENEGNPFWFEVFDNGEGKNADPDQMSLYFWTAATCEIDFAVDLYDIEGGNVQVVAYTVITIR